MQYYRDKSRETDEKARTRIVRTEREEEHARNALLSLPVRSPFLRAVLGGNSIQLIPQIPKSARITFSVDFDPHIQMALVGQFGKNFSLKVNYNTQATFSFENRLNFDYQGEEDDIVKRVGIGNVNMSFTNNLISGTQNLFGLHTDLQFGRTYINTVLSQQRSQIRHITLKNGTAVKDFQLRASHYEENAHYFLSQFFRDHYDRWLRNYPILTSGLHISRIEV